MKLSEMFPSRFLRGQDLQAAILVVITGIEQTKVHPRPGAEELKWILRFHRLDPRTNKPAPLATVASTELGHGLILRRTLAEQIAHILDSDDTDNWIGKRIVLEPSHARAAGRDVTTISARAPKQTAKTDQVTPAAPSDTTTQEATK